jgi:hypothetical protein
VRVRGAHTANAAIGVQARQPYARRRIPA